MAEVTLLRCSLFPHPTTGAIPRVPIKQNLPDDPGELRREKLPPMPGETEEERPEVSVNANVSQRQRDELIAFFIVKYGELAAQSGAPALPVGVDPDWYFERVVPEPDEAAAGFGVVWELRRSSPIVPLDLSNSRAAKGVQLQSEVPMTPGSAPAMPPVLPAGATPPPSAPPTAPVVGPTDCGGPKCATVDGTELHDAATCPARGR